MDVRIRGTGIRTKQEEQREGYRQIIIEEAIATLNIEKNTCNEFDGAHR